MVLTTHILMSMCNCICLLSCFFFKEYKPRWGYKRANDETKQWCIEVPDNAGKFNIFR